MDGDVDQTIQWARESLQRRRSELKQKKQQSESDNASFEEDTSNAVDVSSILERGRALLQQAEAHSEALGRYTVHGLDEDEAEKPNDGDFMARFLKAADERECIDSKADLDRKPFANIPVERPSWNHRFDQDDNVDTNAPISTRNEENDDIQELLKEGEARARLDNLIATIRRQGDDPLAAEMTSQSNAKQVSNFDPNELRAAKRAAIKKSKLDEELAQAEKEARNLSKFKALPLPGGVEVKHDLFAPTLAFQGKHSGIEFIRNDTKRVGFNDISSSQSLGGFESFDRMSMATSHTSIDGSLNCSFADGEDKERALQLRQAKKMKKKRLLDSVNKTIAEETGEAVDEDASVAYSVQSTQSHVDYLEDPSKLRQQIARLEAKLKRKKSQRSATLNDIVDIDLNSIFERLLSKDADENARQIVDQLKHRVCGNVVDGILVDDFRPQFPKTKEHHSLTAENNRVSKRVLYERQENWVKHREQKLLEARLRLEAEEMNDITGKPQLTHAKDSWKKAKDAHDEALKRVAEEDSRKQREKAERERVEYIKKMKEAEDLERQTREQMKSMRSEVNREEQMKRLEKLSQPRQIRIGPTSTSHDLDTSSPLDVSINVTNDSKPKASHKSSETPYEHSSAHKSPTKKVPKLASATSEFVEFSGKRFSEMDDKEFSKIVKRISKMAKQKVRDAAAAESYNNVENTSPKLTIIGNPDNLCEEPIEFAGGMFVGSAAQAKFMAQLSRQS